MSAESDGVVESREQTGRRDAMKKGAAAAGVVAGSWVAPVVSGIGITPAAAAGCSNPLPNPPLPSSRTYSFNVNTNSGGCSDPAEWIGQTQTFTETFNNTCSTVTLGSVTAKAPVGNIDDPCFHTVASIVSFSGWSSCNITSFTVNSCPPAGIAAPNGCGRIGAGGCSAALNGSGSGTVYLVCNA